MPLVHHSRHHRGHLRFHAAAGRLEDFALLIAYGANVWTRPGSENELRYDYFVGIRYNIGK
jgi:hypothetical protein